MLDDFSVHVLCLRQRSLKHAAASLQIDFVCMCLAGQAPGRGGYRAATVSALARPQSHPGAYTIGAASGRLNTATSFELSDSRGVPAGKRQPELNLQQRDGQLLTGSARASFATDELTNLRLSLPQIH